MRQERNAQKAPASFYLLLVAVLCQGLSGLAGGIGLIGDPSGKSLSIPIEWLQGSPFGSYFVPGLVLFFALGVFPILVAIGMWQGRAWSWSAALLVGLMLVIWIAVEILIVGYQTEPPLQLFYGLLGLTIVVVAMLPTLRPFLKEHGK